MPDPPVFLSHPSSLEHGAGGDGYHPEQPARIVAIERELERRGGLGLRRIESPAVPRSVLERVHPPAYVDAIAAISERGGGRIDLDTAMSAGSYNAALHAAGGAVALVELLVAGEAASGFSAHRPPGHHAPRAQAMGFCLFNNIAVAAAHALEGLGLERVLILDWDVHHGNGTNDIFHASDRVLFVSIHQSPLYPGTGSARDVGSGAGQGYTVNLPVPAGTGDGDYISLIEHLVVPLGERFAPQLVLISAGYDAHRDDPLAGCEVTEDGYGEMTATVRRLATALGAPVGYVLEGGYDLRALASSVARTLEELAEPEPELQTARPAAAPPTPLTRAALDRLARHWPGL
jgi:acetoin utilization deacetylase AcuC-like enzyme